jgi:acetyltransferase-like isoleucine patch superfamily enzyme
MAAVEMRHFAIRGLDAEEVTVGRDVRIGERTRICARSVVLGDRVAIGDDVTIACDTLRIGAETRVGDRGTILSPEIAMGERGIIGPNLHAELNEQLVLGRLCDVGASVRLIGQGVRAGDHLWLTDSVVVGGGGARGPRSYLVIGDRSAVMDRCYINLSDSVTIGSDTALSNGVMILTHSMWQSVLEGGTSQFAPVHIGSRCIIYVNAVVAPGVTIGNDVTVAAGTLVVQNVPDSSTAIGNPARVMRSTPLVPRQLPDERRDAIVRDVLREWAPTLAVKGASAAYVDGQDRVTVMFRDATEIICYRAQAGPVAPDPAATISLAFGPAPARLRARCHFDLSSRSVSGTLSPIAEDLRDFLRRRTIRIYSDRPFQPLRPANLERLRARLQSTR